VSNRIKSLLVVALFFAAFTGISIVRLVTLWHADGTTSWTPATGRVTATAYAKSAWYDNFQFSGRRRSQVPMQRRQTPDQLVPKIAYEYIVAGRTYVGTRYQFSRVPYEMGEIQAMFRQHPVASSIPLYFDPAQPSQSVLKIGADPTDKTVGVLTGGFAVCAGFYLIWAGLLSSGFSSTPPEPKPQ
jgi:hypothetical protein